MTRTAGERIRTARLDRGWSQAELVRGVDLSDSYVSLIESGRRNPTRRVLRLLAERLGVTVDELVGGRDAEEAAALDHALRVAEIALHAGDTAAARQGFAAALAQAQAAGDGYLPEAGAARWGLAVADEQLGDVVAAIAGYERLAEDTEPDGRGQTGPVDRVTILGRLCRAYAKAGRLRRAAETGERALAELRASGDAGLVRDEAEPLLATLAYCYHQRGDHRAARRLARTAAARAETGASPRARAAAYWACGGTAEARGDDAAARLLADRALAIYRQADDAWAAVVCRAETAALLLQGPDPDRRGAALLLIRALADLAALDGPDVPGAEPYEQYAVSALARFASGDAAGAAVSCARTAVEAEHCGTGRRAAVVWRRLADALALAARAGGAPGAGEGTRPADAAYPSAS